MLPQVPFVMFAVQPGSLPLVLLCLWFYLEGVEDSLKGRGRVGASECQQLVCVIIEHQGRGMDLDVFGEREESHF